jgi:multicomponent Na+:H+ antiporter subunit D
MNYLLILIPFLALFLLNLFPKSKAAFWTSLILFAAQALVPFAALSHITIAPLESIFGFNLLLDKIGLVLILSTAIVGAAALITSWFTIKEDKEKLNFINLLLIAQTGINGIALVADIFSLYIFIEVTAIATFVLITLFRNKEALEGVLKYLILSVVATALMLSSIALFVLIAGGTSFAALKAVPLSNPLALIALVLFLCGLSIKGGLMPFHGWLADAYSAAPAAVSVFLAGIVTKASGLFTIIRLLTSLGGGSANVNQILMAVGAISIVGGALAALGQKDIKRMLAYSSISQMGYIIIAFAAGTNLGMIAALFHFFNHAIFKSQLFANAAAIEKQLGIRDMDKMGGLAARMPVTGTTSALASLSTAGVPPLSGFWSKLLVILVLWSTGHYVYAVIAVFASVLTLGYFLSFQRRVFFGKVSKEWETVKEAEAGLLVPPVILSLITITVGLIFPFILPLVLR